MSQELGSDRPDPDALLQKVMREEAPKRGRLRIFFGACAGVGKTYSMLQSAHARLSEGVDVVIGVVETHGRGETARLIDGLEVIPPARREYRGKHFDELDLDAILLRKPGLLLVDELAHSNIPGGRHPKRWHDVEEILTAGIDVFTTLNVQHLESLNDVVGEITGVRVRETLPDRTFQEADDVTLVDLPPEDLLERMKAGKVYVPEAGRRQAEQSFFRKGNLIALRELALRRTADRVDAQMRDYRADLGISRIWEASDRVMVCIGPNPDSLRLVREAARLAGSLRAPWLALYVETPGLQTLSEAKREMIFRTLRMVEELGGESATVPGTSVAEALVEFARERNVNTLVMGQSRSSGQWWWSRLFLRELASDVAARLPGLRLHLVGPSEKMSHPQQVGESSVRLQVEDPIYVAQGILAAVAGSVLVTILGKLGHPWLDLASHIMLYLAAVIFVAYRYGRIPGLVAAVVAVGCFDFFFVPPFYSFTVADTSHLVTFAIMLLVSSVVGSLTSQLRSQARISVSREKRAALQHQVARDLAAALTFAKAVDIAVGHVAALHGRRILVLLPDSRDSLRVVAGDVEADKPDTGVARWCYEHRKPAGRFTDTVPDTAMLYLPLPGAMRVRGVLALNPQRPEGMQQPEQMRLLETLASQLGQTLERIHFTEVASDSLLRIEAERLRNSLLGSVSHDLRTPLAALVGSAGELKARLIGDPGLQGLAANMEDSSRRLVRIVENLLQMARLQSGQVRLHKAAQPLEEALGSALASLPGSANVTIDLPSSLPPVMVDGTLVERLLFNLVENALKFGGKEVRIGASPRQAFLEVFVEDDGPGILPGRELKIFEKFQRGDDEGDLPGVGLGLAICRSIVEAHGGWIRAENRQPHGAKFLFTLPIAPLPAGLQEGA